MPNTDITIPFERERLKALRFYAGKKDCSLEAELNAFLERLYDKYVPAQTRAYIEMLAQEEDARPQPSIDRTAGS